ncbi:unnamed protein product [Ectocarpus sp. 12 AP-2014]
MAISRKQMQRQQSRSTARRKDRTIRIDLSQCKYGVVKACARDMGWSTNEGNKGRREKGGSEGVGGRWDVYWTDTSVSLQRVMRMRGLQKINHFPGICAICRKGDLARSLSRMQREFPEEYAFFPRTWVLPADKADFKEEILTANARRIKNKVKNPRNRKNNVNGDEDNDGDDDVNSSKSGRAKRGYYIVKPVGGCQAKIMFSHQRLEESIRGKPGAHGGSALRVEPPTDRRIQVRPQGVRPGYLGMPLEGHAAQEGPGSAVHQQVTTPQEWKPGEHPDAPHQLRHQQGERGLRPSNVPCRTPS